MGTKPTNELQQKLKFQPMTSTGSGLFTFGHSQLSSSSQVSDKMDDESQSPQQGSIDNSTLLKAINDGSANIQKQLVDIKKELLTAAEERDNLKTKVGKLETENATLRTQVKELEVNQSTMDSALRRKNLIIGGIPGDDSETQVSCMNAIMNILSDQLGINNCRIDKAYRIHRAKTTPKPIVVKFETETARDEALNKANSKRKDLGGIWIKPDISKKERETRKLLAPFYEQAMKDKRNKVVKVVRDFLLVDNQRWNYDPVTEMMIKAQ